MILCKELVLIMTLLCIENAVLIIALLCTEKGSL